MIVQHSAATPEHYTPPEFIEAARATMGGIDLDPATTPSVNAWSVKASSIFTKDDDGLSKAWRGRVWLNPPGGKLKKAGDSYIVVKDGPGESSAAVWWAKLAREYFACRIEQAIFLGFTLEILRSTQEISVIWPGDLPFCVPDSRIRFLHEADGGFVAGKSPSHANIIVYLPPAGHDVDAVRRFERHFSKFGRVRT